MSLQIVEGAQIDRAEPGPERRSGAPPPTSTPWSSSAPSATPAERRYGLEAFVDPAAVFISRKSQGGGELLALERPGLWNGAMAHWHTVFVEVPIETFARSRRSSTPPPRAPIEPGRSPASALAEGAGAWAEEPLLPPLLVGRAGESERLVEGAAGETRTGEGRTGRAREGRVEERRKSSE